MMGGLRAFLNAQHLSKVFVLLQRSGLHTLDTTLISSLNYVVGNLGTLLASMHPTADVWYLQVDHRYTSLQSIGRLYPGISPSSPCTSRNICCMHD